MFKEPPGEQRRALERAAAVAPGTLRVGDQEGHGADGVGTHRRRRGVAPETAGQHLTSVHILESLFNSCLLSKQNGPYERILFVKPPTTWYLSF